MSNNTDSDASINSLRSKKSTFEQQWEAFLAGENAGSKRMPDCFEQKYGKIEIISSKKHTTTEVI
jgi:hypothetical protein